MDNRREFIKKAAILAGSGLLPASVLRAFEIDPAVGSTWLDAEHVVILMQENRSFDHCFGKLRGVRGYRDPRAVVLPSGDPVFLQRNAAGETYAPFRLDIRDTRATWMGSLPHSWTDQTDARNDGHYDKWLVAKHSGNAAYAHMPLTLGYYDRRDIPFYYSLADAFTVCDQSFCSSLTGTTPNRLHLWSGTIREGVSSRARVRNDDTDYGVEASWKTFPERLQEAGVDWRVYQNELSVYKGFKGEEEDWLANFTDNPLEWFTQYSVRSSPAASAGGTAAGPLDGVGRELHERAFTRNAGDPHFRSVDTFHYDDNGVSREMKAPKGDVFHQFRADVAAGKLPTVSWLVAPAHFSDHPGSPWYGAWYVSEAMDILTSNPAVWKKTIFVLCYDENDGYFDHVPPFVAPDPSRPETGRVSAGIDTAVEYHTLDSDLKKVSSEHGRGGPIGLGYRVPLVIASPWSRGGFVNSQVFDHTSILMMLEKLLSHKTGRAVRETNISEWRRTVCGDLSSVFRPYNGEKVALPSFLSLEGTLKDVNQAQYRDLPSGFHALTAAEISAAREAGHLWKGLPEQERGTRPSCALPYTLNVMGFVEGKNFILGMRAMGDAGAPFTAYVNGQVRNYAVKAGQRLADTIVLKDGKYHVKVYGPNGYFWEFAGRVGERRMGVGFLDGKISIGADGGGALTKGAGAEEYAIIITDNAYGAAQLKRKVKEREWVAVEIRDHRWYDLTVRVEGADGFLRRFAGRVENGSAGVSDPAMA